MEVQKAKRAAEILKHIDELNDENYFLEEEFFRQLDMYYGKAGGGYEFFGRLKGFCNNVFESILNHTLDKMNSVVTDKFRENVKNRIDSNNKDIENLKRELEEL